MLSYLIAKFIFSTKSGRIQELMIRHSTLKVLELCKYIFFLSTIWRVKKFYFFKSSLEVLENLLRFYVILINSDI